MPINQPGYHTDKLADEKEDQDVREFGSMASKYTTPNLQGTTFSNIVWSIVFFVVFFKFLTDPEPYNNHIRS